MSNSTNSLREQLQKAFRLKKLRRAEFLIKAQNDVEFRAALIEKARRDPIFFFNQFLWTYDPRPDAKPNHFPFLTYPFQDDLIHKIEENYKNHKDLLLDKSRDMGVTWVVLGLIVWHWLFDDSFKALIGSEKEDKCDNWDEDSLFGKVDYILRRLPDWFLPPGFDHSKHRTFMSVTNPKNMNSILGDSANKDFSRGGRYSLVFLDEFAFWNWGASVWTATADTTQVRIPVSTPHGKANKFADLRHGGDIDVMSLHWKLHPLKDSEWYESEKKRRSPREIAQELDIDYEASGTERVFTLKSDKVLYENVFIEPFALDSSWGFRGGLDYGTRNISSFHVYAMDYDHDHYVIWEWRKNMDDLRAEGFKGSMVQALAKAIFNCPYVELMDAIQADPSLWVKNQNSSDGMTSINIQLMEEIDNLNKKLMDAGYKSKKVPGIVQGAQSDMAAIEVVASMWVDPLRPQLKIFKNCRGLMSELEDLMWEDWSDMQQEKRSKRETIQDKNNHSWDDLKYYIMSRHSGPVVRPRKPRTNLEAAEMQMERESQKRKDTWR